ncbi:MAG: hypothetical protein ISR58_05600 [Anaerolineales bacterium]|nr:hypothetical protein [Chloroflexota bacterium]MBL6980650.1 hypothetical protein [Anaerolineales bacterium]
MFKPIRWKTFARDFLVIQVGFALFGLSIALLIRANLGTGPWAMLEVALSQILGLTPGTMSVIVGFVVLSASFILRERIGWGTVANMMFIGPWEDLALHFIPSVTGNLVLQGAMLLAGILLMGIASAVYIGVDAGAGPRDSLMLAVKRISGRSLRLARGSIEVALVFVAWMLGGPAGIGTVVHALLIGPSVQMAFKLFKVEPHMPDEAIVESESEQQLQENTDF